jgi:hypothetical protein
LRTQIRAWIREWDQNRMPENLGASVREKLDNSVS